MCYQQLRPSLVSNDVLWMGKKDNHRVTRLSSPIPRNTFSISSLPAGPDLPNPTTGSELAVSGNL
jgi:hypothetical protein